MERGVGSKRCGMSRVASKKRCGKVESTKYRMRCVRCMEGQFERCVLTLLELVAAPTCAGVEPAVA